MGLFNKLIHFVTGGSAEVSIHLENASLSKPFNLDISALTLKDDLKCKKVYLLIRCKEEKLEEFKPLDESDMTDNEKILQEMKEWDSNIIYKDEIVVANHCKLNKGEKYNWSLNVDLTKASLHSQVSSNYQVIWQVQAGIDVSGNDPDSGWINIEVTP